MAQMVANPPVTRETWVWSLGWEDLLEEGMTTIPIFLPGKFPWTEKPGGLQSMGLQRVGHDCIKKYICLYACLPQIVKSLKKS